MLQTQVDEHTMHVSNKVTLKLHYYKGAGRANQIRLALALCSIDWEEVNPAGFPPSPEDRAKWIAIGGNTTTNIPMLELSDGRVFTQSSAVLRAAARLGGIMPKNDELLYLTDKLIADADDYRSVGYKSLIPFGATPEAAENFLTNDVPKHLGNLERQLGEKDFYMGEELSVADCTVYDVVTSFGSNLVVDVLQDFPKLKAFVERFEANPNISAYLSGPIYEGLMKFGPDAFGR